MVESKPLTPAKLRAKKKKQPTFKQMNYGRPDRKKVKASWRRPRGIDNKQRVHSVSAGCVVSIGYRNKKEIRGLHPSGKEEIRVFNLSGLDGVGKDCVIRIAGSIGAKKRKEIIGKAKEKGIRVLNA